MSDQCEEQQMEQEALEAIFDDSLQVLSAEQPFHWAITIFPEQHGAEAENHVGITLKAKIPLDYPEGESLPDFDVDIVKGLTEEHAQELKQIANEEAEANRGMPVVFAVCERLREWLAENNQTGMDDVSMYAQMMRKQKEQEKREQKAQQEFESQKQVDGLTEAEAEELAVRKRRAEGTPCNKENFEAWNARFQKEMADRKVKEKEEDQAALSKKKQKDKTVDKSGRLTGFQHFSGKSGMMVNFDEAMEAQWENAEKDEDELSDDEADLAENVDEDLFDVDDDDLDDLDFDDDDDEEEPDI